MIFTVGPSCSRYIGGSRPDANSNFDLATLGFPASAYSQLPILGYFGRYLLDGYIGLGNYFSNNVTNTFAVHPSRSEEHTSELQSHLNLVCRLLLEKKNMLLLMLPMLAW